MNKILTTLFSLTIFCLSFFIYYLTLCPTVYWSDSAEFSLAGWTAGIPHPPGYPCYVMINYILMHIFHLLLPTVEIAFWSNLISAIFSTLTLVFIYLIVFSFTSNPIVGIFSSFTLGFTNAFWRVSNVAEVYTFTTFIFVVILYLLLRIEKIHSDRYLYIIAFFLGLGLTNHLTLLSIFPAVAYILFPMFFCKVKGINISRIIKASIFFIIGLSPYLYVILRAFAEPCINWGRCSTINNFFDFITYKEYAWLKFKRTPIQVIETIFSLLAVFNEFTIVGVILGIIGIFYLFLHHKRFLFFFVISLTGLLLFLGNYGQSTDLLPEYRQHFLIGVVLFSILVGIGANTFHKKLFGVIFLLLPFFLLVQNFHKNDKHKYFFAYDYGINLLSILPQNSIFVSESDGNSFVLWYLQHIKQLRPDVLTIFSTILSSRWYQEEIRSRKNKIDISMLENIVPSIKEKYGIHPYVAEFIRVNLKNYPVYGDYVPQELFEKNINIYPLGIAFAFSDNPNEKINVPKLFYRGVNDKKIYKDEMAQKIIRNYARAHQGYANYYLLIGQKEASIKESRKLKEIIDSNPDIFTGSIDNF